MPTILVRRGLEAALPALAVGEPAFTTDSHKFFVGSAGGNALIGPGGGGGGVTSVNVSGGTTGLTFTGGPITTAGTITMAGTLAVASGGTGATSSGAALAALSAQPLDADLTALAGLGGTGLAVRTAANTWAQRSLTAGAGISITNPDGVAGNPTISATGGGGASPLTTKGDVYTRSSTADARLPVGTNGQVLTADSAVALGVKWADPAGGGVTVADSATIDLTLTGTVLSGVARHQMTVDEDPGGLKLVGDLVAPGPYRYYGTDQAGTRGWLALPRPSAVPGGRLTLTSGVPITTVDVGGPNLYYTPFLHNIITLWNGYMWAPYEFAEIYLALGTMVANALYDIFAFWNGSSVELEKTQWSGTTNTRTIPVEIIDGRYCKQSNPSRLYLGTIRTDINSTINTCDFLSKRFVFNNYNRRPRRLFCTDISDSWQWTSNSWREANNNPGTLGVSRVGIVLGLSEEPVTARNITASYVTGATNSTCAVGIGVDNPTVNSGQIQGSGNDSTSAKQHGCDYHGWPGIGYHQLIRIEVSSTLQGNTVFIGDAGQATWTMGMIGWVVA
jgi:hypothetical protein